MQELATVSFFLVTGFQCLRYGPSLGAEYTNHVAKEGPPNFSSPSDYRLRGPGNGTGHLMPNPASVSAELSKLRVAIVHYWFVGRAGGERVVEALAEIFPQADLFSLIADRSTLAPILQDRKLQTSFLQRFPGAKKFYRQYLLLQPLALEQFDLSNYDLVISSESGPAKGVITSPKTCHICYCHSPMRYIWDMYSEYKRGMRFPARPAFSLTAHYLRLWDHASASRVDYFVANSRFIASRIRKCYGRESTVIYPPVEVSAGRLTAKQSDYYIAIGRLVGYKRFDLAIAACTRLGRRLKIIGAGPQERTLRRMAGPDTEFLGWLGDTEMREQLAGCRALLFPGEEDFGIVPVEAQSFGKPVIAYASGGILETVRGVFPNEPGLDNPTAVFFTASSVSGLTNALLEFESMEQSFRPEMIRQHSMQFDSRIFKRRMSDFVVSALTDFRERNQGAVLEDKVFDAFAGA